MRKRVVKRGRSKQLSLSVCMSRAEEKGLCLSGQCLPLYGGRFWGSCVRLCTVADPACVALYCLAVLSSLESLGPLCAPVYPITSIVRLWGYFSWAAREEIGPNNRSLCLLILTIPGDWEWLLGRWRASMQAGLDAHSLGICGRGAHMTAWSLAPFLWKMCYGCHVILLTIPLRTCFISLDMHTG